MQVLLWGAVVVYVVGVVVTVGQFARNLRARGELLDVALTVGVALLWPIARPIIAWVDRQDAVELRRQHIGEHYVPEPMPRSATTE